MAGFPQALEIMENLENRGGTMCVTEQDTILIVRVRPRKSSHIHVLCLRHLTLKAPITAADDKFCDIFPDFRTK